MAYYLKFIEKYPRVGDLARDSEDNVLKLWQGLGYYSRARNLHQTAKLVQDQYKGVFPKTYQELIGLKGIGPYTAAAIASIAFHEPVAVLDGNVYRVLSRYYGIDTPIDLPAAKKEFTLLANTLVPLQQAGDFNQAMMDFGATLCTPRNPGCMTCMLAETCFAARHQLQHQFPVKAKKTQVKERRLHYLFVTDGKDFLVQQRQDKDIWKGLYELVLLEEKEDFVTLQKELAKTIGLPATRLLSQQVYEAKHILTHRVIHSYFYLVKVDRLPVSKTWKRTNRKNYQQFAVSRLTEKFFESPWFQTGALQGKLL
jgi:A/G-specific adenine glycosylase